MASTEANKTNRLKQQKKEDGSCVMERIEPREHQPTIWAVDPTPGEYAAAASDAMFGPGQLQTPSFVR